MSEAILKAVAKALAHQSAEFEQKLKSIQSSLDSVASFDQIEKAKESLSDLIKSQESKFLSIISEKEASVASIGEQFSKILDDVESNQKSFSTIQTDIINLRDMLQVESAAKADISKQIEKIQNDVEVLYADAIKKTDEQIKAATEQAANYSGLSESLTAIKSAFDLLQEKTSALITNDVVDEKLHIIKSEFLNANKELLDSVVKSTSELNDRILSISESIESIQLKAGPKGDAGSDGKDGIGIFTDVWKAGIYRADSLVTHYEGQYFKALEDTASEPGTDNTWERIGTVGRRFRGGFDPEANYIPGDEYVKDFGTFVVMADGRHRLQHARGPKGPKGDAGPKGIDAPVIKSIHYAGGVLMFEMSDGNVFPVEIKE